MNSEKGFVQFKADDNRWDVAKDAVDYPVDILPAFFKEDGEFKNAMGLTNTGRDKQYCLVIVDKLRDGNNMPIAAVSGKYGSLPSTEVYAQLQSELSVLEESNEIKSLFVTENGGSQQLTIKMNDMMSMEGVPDALDMMIRLNTSVDGSKSHTLSMVISNRKGGTEIHAYGGDYNLSARHTKTIGTRSAYYIPTIQKMIENWNDIIIPTMSLMYDCKFNRNVALELISGICEDSKMGEAHEQGVRDLYTSISLKTDDDTDSLYRINMAMNQYLDEEMHDLNRAKIAFKDSVTKSIQKQLNKLKIDI